ncbi:unnamed protein product [Allacma fusca]|uniref:MGA conserved domain-containing protein n=1 Tax=Allacma fusca TaxID=39272 RepID=A0A8J2PQ85_9HEXA|nr:unnamed protein product [Allacma fusca]
MPLLNKEVEDFPEDGSSDMGSSMSSEYRFRLQLMNDNVNDTPPPISPNSTAFDPGLRRGQVKIIRTGDTMHVLTYEVGGKPMITSYAKPLSSTWREASPRPRIDMSPIRSNFKIEGESAIRTISRYCFPSCIEAQLDNLTLQEILSQAQILAEKWLNASDNGLNESHKAFLRNQFLPAKLETVVMRDWEILVDIFETHHLWKIEQSMYDSSPNVVEVSYKKSSCVKTLPRLRLAKKRKEDLKNYEAFVDMGERLDLQGLRKKRGKLYTYVINHEKAERLTAKSMYYSNYNMAPIRRKSHVSKVARHSSNSYIKTAAQVKLAKKKAIKANRLLKNAKSDKNSDKLNPRRDKPMAKIRSQIRKIDRFAKMNGESFHNAALTLSKNRGLSNAPIRVVAQNVNDSDAGHNIPRSSDSEPYLAIREKDLDLGLEGVCFDADVAELANSMVETDLEDLEGLGRYQPELNISNASDQGAGSMVEALHAAINYVPEYPDEPFVEKSFQDIASMDDGLLEAIDTTLGVDIDVTNLMGNNTNVSKEEIFLMTGLTAAEHRAFDSLGQQLISSEAAQKGDSTPKDISQAKRAEPQGKASDATNSCTDNVSPLADCHENSSSSSNSNATSDNQEKEAVSVKKIPDEGTTTPTPPPSPRKDTPKSNHVAVVADDSLCENVPTSTQVPLRVAKEFTDCSTNKTMSTKSNAQRKSEMNLSKSDNTVSVNTHRKSMPAALIHANGRGQEATNPASKKAKTLLQCTLTGSYWQIPENKFPCNRPKRANAGALMTTKSGSRNRDRDNSSTEPCPPGKRRNSKVHKVWAGKFTKKSNYAITPDDMIVSKKAALRCILSIPDEICPTSHEEFLHKHRRFFGDVDMSELQELINKFKPKVEVTAALATIPPRKSGMEKYLKRLAAKRTTKRSVDPSGKDMVTPETTAAAESDASSETKVKLQPVKAQTITHPVPKPKPYARHKKFEEDEKIEIIKLENNQILADGVIYNVDHENYLKEKDVEVPYDDHQFSPPDLAMQETAEMVKVKCNGSRKLPYCVYGCVCESIDQAERETKLHCGKLKCMLECSCNASCWTKEDADIRSRLRPRVSMLNWSSRLNYLDALISPEREKEPPASKNNEGKAAPLQGYGRIKRNIVPPKRNNDFVSHSPSKKFRDASSRPLTRQTNKIPPFKAIGNRLRLKRQQFLRPMKNSHLKDDRLKLKLQNSPRLKSEEVEVTHARDSGLSNEVERIPRQAYSRINLQRNAIQRRTALQASIDTLNAKSKRNLMAGVDYSLEGTGPVIPPDLMARFAPFMEIQFRPKPDKCIPLLSDSEDSTEDENDEEYANITYKRAPIFVTKTEETFSTPVIVSYRSCQDGSP